MGKKRGRQAAELEDGIINIRLSSGAPLAAKANILRSCSSCAEGLPADAQEWDISQLRVEGQPVQRSTVIAFLNCAYSRILDSEFQRQQEDPRCSTSSLTQLLAFADAVGASRGVLAACLSELHQLRLKVQLQLQSGDNVLTQDMTLSTEGQGLFLDNDSDIPVEGANLRLGEVSPSRDEWLPLKFDDVGSTVAQAAAFCRAVAQQVEPLLFLAHSLQLTSLQSRLECFVAGCCMYEDGKGVLYGELEHVFTGRVVGAMLPPNATQEAKDAYIQKVLTWKCGFVNKDGILERLCPVPGTAADRLKFSATLTRDFLGGTEGEKVDVEVDLLEGFVRIGVAVLPAQLLLGPAITCDRDYQLLMTGKEEG